MISSCTKGIKRRLEDLFSIRKDRNVNSPEKVLVSLRGDTSRDKRVGEYMSSGRSS
ncbi:MAG: hypothetical protein V1862_09170 [Methanobacteriota archaeon]